MKNNKSFQGTVFLIIATLSHGLYGVFSRIIGVEFGQVFQVVARSSLLLIFFLVIVFYQKSWKKIETKDYKWYLLMIIPGLVALISMFIAFNNLSLGTVLFTYYAASTLGSYLIGVFLYQEKIDRIKVISLLFCFVGLYQIFSGSLQLKNLTFIFLACLAGLGAALWNTVSKKISGKYHVNQILVMDNLLMVVVGLPIALFLHEKVTLPTISVPWLGIVGYAIAAVGTSIFTIKGFKYLQAQVGSLILLLEPVFGVVVGWLIYQEALTFGFSIGAILILIGAALPNLKQIKIK